MVLGQMTDSIRQALPTASIAREAVDPLEGALWRARHAQV
jgi:hypothetical protein